ncbi:MAG: twin-arginine translocase subunit TatC [Candidatus Omnitrophica bacterium]|nr:twin-arginine translocase subunit TatC [Candidatus Omnitrophota bacterium]
MEANSLFAHLAELRRRILICLIVWFAFSFGFYPLSLLVLEKITEPIKFAVFNDPMEIFTARMSISFLGGVIFGFPIIAWQIWAFIRPALGKKSGRGLLVLSLLSSTFFISGVAFGQYIAVPVGLNFLLSAASDKFVPMITVSNYLSFWLVIVLYTGVIFLLPLVMSLLAFIKIIGYPQIVALRKYIYVGIFIVSAILTPPDVVSQLMLAVPMLVLFEIGAILVRVINNRE